MKPSTILLALVIGLALPTQAEGSPIDTLLLDPVDASRDRTVPIKVYLKPADQPLPVVLFSHGLGGSREASPFLGNHWAEAGYVPVFVQHPGSDESVWKSEKPANRIAAMKEAANLRATLARNRDIPFVIDQLERWNQEEGHPLHRKLDLDHIGMSGHSFGARTTQAVMGENFPLGIDFAEPRISAFLPFSPSISKRLAPAESFGHIEAPVLLMTGTKDGSPLDPAKKPEDRTKVFTVLSEGDKFQLVLFDAEHSAFSSTPDGFRGERKIPHHHPAIQTISTLFWDAYLKGDEAAKSLLQSRALRQAADLVDEDRWEWK